MKKVVKFISNKILVKSANDVPAMPKAPAVAPAMPSQEASTDEGTYIGKHSFQGTQHHGTKADFEPHSNLFEPIAGPVHSIPDNSTHVGSIKPDHGPAFSSIMNDITAKGGKPFLVGGYPRDWALGKDSKDKDVEVYGMHPDQVAETLKPHGEVNTVGSSFGVTKLKTPDGQDYDFSLPRRENKEGQGHKGFQVQPDPNMTQQEAASRRDFTINSMMQDPHTGQIHDHFNGLDDLKNKTLRATSEKYKEDPLRVLRGMQLAGRMGMDMDPGTAEMSKQISHEYPTLSKDRVMTEWQKLAEKSHIPSKGLKVLQDTDWIKHYPELELTPEKMATVDNMAKKLQGDKSFSNEDKNALFFSSLTHDMPKENVASFLDRVGMPANIRKRVISLKNGLDSPHANDAEPSDATARNLSSHVAPESIDNLMHVMDSKHNGMANNHRNLHDTAKRLGVNQAPPQPFINGKSLTQIGIKPGPAMGNILKDVYQAQLDGHITNPEEALQYVNKMTHQAALFTDSLSKSGLRLI